METQRNLMCSSDWHVSILGVIFHPLHLKFLLFIFREIRWSLKSEPYYFSLFPEPKDVTEHFQKEGRRLKLFCRKKNRRIRKSYFARLPIHKFVSGHSRPKYTQKKMGKLFSCHTNEFAVASHHFVHILFLPFSPPKKNNIFLALLIYIRRVKSIFRSAKVFP